MYTTKLNYKEMEKPFNNFHDYIEENFNDNDTYNEV